MLYPLDDYIVRIYLGFFRTFLAGALGENTTYLTRPISSGKLRLVGRVVNQNRMQFIAESIVYDSKGNEIGRGNGIFVRSKKLLEGASGYVE